MEWFSNNGLKANPDKFHLILNDTGNDLYGNPTVKKIYIYFFFYMNYFLGYHTWPWRGKEI